MTEKQTVKKSPAKEAKVEKPETKVAMCKSCGQELVKLPWDSRSKAGYVIVCNNPTCALYRQFQGKGGKIPVAIRTI